ncbi:MAG: hypothetical protein AAB389_01750 [Patescibacteria group bacterium]
MADRFQEDVLKDLEKNPDQHRHATYEELVACCTVLYHGKPVLDLSLMDAHLKSAPIAHNGGQPCDVFEGPCSCGAWHHKGEPRNWLIKNPPW